MKQISIIIPVYNAEKNVRRCLDSLLNQTSMEFEAILLDDGSTDNSLSILREYEKRESIFKVFTHGNKGVVKTRQRGMEIAVGKFIMFVDNDDFLEKDYIETFLKAINENDADCIIGGYKRVSSLKTIFEVKPKNNDWAKFMIVAPWARIYKREFLVKNNIEFLDYKIGEDIYFNLSVYSKTNKVFTIEYVGYNWYYNNESVSNTSQKKLKDEIDILYLLNKLNDLYKEKNEEYFEWFLSRYIIWYLLFSGRNSTYTQFMNQYNELIEWTKLKNVHFYFPCFSRKISGERVTIRLSSFLFSFIHHCKLIKLFARFYTKGV